jgi:hypothetical protein
MSKRNLKDEDCESDLETLVKVEFETLNEKPYYGQITNDELLYLWVSVFNRKKEELFGITSSKSLTRKVRAIYKLKAPIKLKEVFDGPNFRYEKYLDDGSVEVTTGRILGFGAQKPAEIGDIVRVTLTTNFSIEPAGIHNWLKLYGTLKDHHQFQTDESSGLKTDIYEADIILRKHIPEYLPMYGQKVQVNYPGIPRMCNRCYLPGHLRRDCNNQKRDWVPYIISLLGDGLDKKFIGSWKNAVQRWQNANINPETKK